LYSQTAGLCSVKLNPTCCSTRWSSMNSLTQPQHHLQQLQLATNPSLINSLQYRTAGCFLSCGPHLLCWKTCLMVAGSVTMTVNLVTMLFHERPGKE
jgi:hypothetical protein